LKVMTRGNAFSFCFVNHFILLIAKFGVNINEVSFTIPSMGVAAG